ncbi:MAG: sensor histidine kinase [Motilibacteraceae bacterium]
MSTVDTAPPLSGPRVRLLRWRRTRAARGAGAAVPLAVAAAAAVAAAVLAVTAADGWDLPASADLPVDGAVGATYPAIAAAVLAGGPAARRLGRLLLGCGLASALTVVLTALALLAPEADLPARLAGQGASFTWVFGIAPLLTLVPLIYPDGRLPGRRWSLAVAAAVAGTGLLAVAVALYPEPFRGRVELVKPFTSEPAARLLAPVGAVLVAAGGLAGFAALVLRLVRSRGLARRQVVVLLGAAALLLAELVVHPLLPSGAGTAAQALAVVLVPAGVAVALTRHRLYELDLALCRTLAGASLAACLAGAYLTAFVVLRSVLPGSTAAAALAAAGTGLLVQPLGARLAAGVDRLYYGERGDPYVLLSRLGAALRDVDDVAAVPKLVSDVVSEGLRLTHVRLQPPGSPTPADAGHVVPLRHRGRVVAELVAAPREGEPLLDPRDRELLAALADQAAPAVAAARLVEDLRASRDALVRAREEERRRLRRELHDGIGPALAGVRLQVESAQDLVQESLGEASLPVRLLDSAVGGVRDAVDDVRRITDDLRPPALDELGLAGALRGLTARLSTPGLPVELAVPDEVSEVELPAAVEVACYRIVAEAVSNAVRHAGAGIVRVRLGQVQGRQLLLVVEDDGQGIVPDRARARTGLGLVTMRERAEELGGTLSIRSCPGQGTTMEAVLPW